MSELIKELSEKYIMYIVNDLKEHEPELLDVPGSDTLIQLGTNILGNLILNFLADNLSAEERLKVGEIMLQAIGCQIKVNFERLIMGAANDEIVEDD